MWSGKYEVEEMMAEGETDESGMLGWRRVPDLDG